METHFPELMVCCEPWFEPPLAESTERKKKQERDYSRDKHWPEPREVEPAHANDQEALPDLEGFRFFARKDGKRDAINPRHGCGRRIDEDTKAVLAFVCPSLGFSRHPHPLPKIRRDIDAGFRRGKLDKRTADRFRHFIGVADCLGETTGRSRNVSEALERLIGVWFGVRGLAPIVDRDRGNPAIGELPDDRLEAQIVGRVRAETKITLANLAYNMRRLT